MLYLDKKGCKPYEETNKEKRKLIPSTPLTSAQLQSKNPNPVHFPSSLSLAIFSSPLFIPIFLPFTSKLEKTLEWSTRTNNITGLAWIA